MNWEKAGMLLAMIVFGGAAIAGAGMIVYYLIKHGLLFGLGG